MITSLSWEATPYWLPRASPGSRPPSRWNSPCAACWKRLPWPTWPRTLRPSFGQRKIDRLPSVLPSATARRKHYENTSLEAVFARGVGSCSGDGRTRSGRQIRLAERLSLWRCPCPMWILWSN
jgi:hypothetical protein